MDAKPTAVEMILESDLFSEVTYYKAICAKSDSSIEFEVIKSDGKALDKSAILSTEYIEKNLISADTYSKVITVGKENKYWTENQIKKLKNIENTDVKYNIDEIRPGDLKQLGMKSLFENIKNEVFTVVFKTKNTEKSKKEYDEEIKKKQTEILEIIDVQRKKRKSISEALLPKLDELIKNPPLPYKEGKLRTLRGFKTNGYKINDGLYLVYDLDITLGIDGNTNIRQVNINEIKELIVNNVKYVLED